MAQPGVVLVLEQKIVNVQSAFPIMPQYQNFSIVATIPGQTQFALPSYPILTGLFQLNINGVTQDILNGDFTVNGNIVTLDGGVNVGDKIAGFYQVLQSNISNAVGSYRSYFAVATQGQTVFLIGFVPNAVLYVAVNGVVQSLGDGDYTLNGQYITLNAGLNSGDKFLVLALQ